MKKLILVCSLLCCSLWASAQFKLGVRAGMSTQDVSPNQLLITQSEDFEELGLSVKNANYGIHFGFFTQIQMGKFFIQPEVLFNSNSTDFSVKELTISNAVGDIRREKYQYLDIPFMMGVKYGPLRLQGGPVGHVFLNSSSELFDINGYDQKFDEMTFGWQAGIGLDIWNFLIDVKYEGRFNNFGDHLVFGDQQFSFDQKPGRFIATLGFAF